MTISVASGKGGTGKTTIAVNLALSLEKTHRIQFLDCDVEEPNAHFGTKTACCVNKFDLNLNLSRRIEDWCHKKSVPVVGKIPFDEHFTRSLVQGIPLTESVENSVSKEIKKMWQRILSLFSSDDSSIEGKQTGDSLLSEYPSRNTNIV